MKYCEKNRKSTYLATIAFVIQLNFPIFLFCSINTHACTDNQNCDDPDCPTSPRKRQKLEGEVHQETPVSYRQTPVSYRLKRFENFINSFNLNRDQNSVQTKNEEDLFFSEFRTPDYRKFDPAMKVKFEQVLKILADRYSDLRAMQIYGEILTQQKPGKRSHLPVSAEASARFIEGFNYIKKAVGSGTCEGTPTWIHQSNKPFSSHHHRISAPALLVNRLKIADRYGVKRGNCLLELLAWTSDETLNLGRELYSQREVTGADLSQEAFNFIKNRLEQTYSSTPFEDKRDFLMNLALDYYSKLPLEKVRPDLLKFLLLNNPSLKRRPERLRKLISEVIADKIPEEIKIIEESYLKIPPSDRDEDMIRFLSTINLEKALNGNIDLAIQFYFNNKSNYLNPYFLIDENSKLKINDLIEQVMISGNQSDLEKIENKIINLESSQHSLPMIEFIWRRALAGQHRATDKVIFSLLEGHNLYRTLPVEFIEKVRPHLTSQPGPFEVLLMAVYHYLKPSLDERRHAKILALSLFQPSIELPSRPMNRLRYLMTLKIMPLLDKSDLQGVDLGKLAPTVSDKILIASRMSQTNQPVIEQGLVLSETRLQDAAPSFDSPQVSQSEFFNLIDEIASKVLEDRPKVTRENIIAASKNSIAKLLNQTFNRDSIDNTRWVMNEIFNIKDPDDQQLEVMNLIYNLQTCTTGAIEGMRNTANRLNRNFNQSTTQSSGLFNALLDGMIRQIKLNLIERSLFTQPNLAHYQNQRVHLVHAIRNIIGLNVGIQDKLYLYQPDPVQTSDIYYAFNQLNVDFLNWKDFLMKEFFSIYTPSYLIHEFTQNINSIVNEDLKNYQLLIEAFNQAGIHTLPEHYFILDEQDQIKIQPLAAKDLLLAYGYLQNAAD